MNLLLFVSFPFPTIHSAWKMNFSLHRKRRKKRARTHTHTQARWTVVICQARKNLLKLIWLVLWSNPFSIFLANKYFDACCLLFNQTLAIMRRVQLRVIASPIIFTETKQQKQQHKEQIFNFYSQRMAISTTEIISMPFGYSQ